MSEPFLLRGLITVSVWSLEATGILLVAWLITFLYRKNAARRHLTWLTAFVTLLLIPPITVVMPAPFDVAVSLPAPVRDLSMIQESLPSSSPHASEAAQETKGATALDKLAVALTTKPVEGTKVVRATRFLRSRAMAILSLFVLWLAGVAAVGLQGIVARYGIGLMRRRSLPCSCTSLDLSDLAIRVGLKRQWKLRVSTRPTPPSAMTWGFLRPVVLLPRDATFWPKERLEAVLLHELAHVRRCDSLSQLMALCVCALYWFHPAVWFCARAMRAAAEVAADDTVLISGLKPSVYAAELLRFAAQLGPHKQSFAGIGVSIMKHSRIEARIKSIVDPTNRRREMTPLEVLKAVGLGGVTLLALSSLRPSISSAQKRHNIPRATMAGARPHTALQAVGSSVATALQRQRSIRRASQRDTITRTNVQADAAFPSRQWAIAPADRQRGAGNAHGRRKVLEVAAHKQAAAKKTDRGTASATRELAAADYHKAMQRKQIESGLGRQGNTSSGAPPVAAITQRALTVERRSTPVAPIEPVQKKVIARPAGPPNQVYRRDAATDETR